MSATAPGRSAPRQARSRERLARILRATGEIVDELGVDRVSIEEVARRAGTSVGSIYRFVASRDDLFVLLAEDIGAAALISMAGIHSAEEATRTPSEIASDTIAGYLGFLESNPGARGLLAATTLPPAARAALTSETLWLERIDVFLGTYSPDLDPARRPLAAALFIRSVEAGLLAALSQSLAERDAALSELKVLLSAYLSALLDDPDRVC